MADQQPKLETERLKALDDRGKPRTSGAHHTYTALVQKLRWALPLSALIIVAVLMIWPKIEVEFSDRRFAPSKLDKAALEQAATENRLLNANFSSTDSKDRPFTINASEAVQENNNPDVILLQNPRGTLRIDDAETGKAESKNGLYEQTRQFLTLNDDVVITRTDGTILRTQTLSIDLFNNEAKTDVPVTIDGPQGHLTAQGMDIQQNGLVTIFPGPAKLILNAENSVNPSGGR